MTKILVVEDDRALNQGIQLSLQSDTIAVQGAHSYSEAKEKMGTQSFDLYLLDVNLPEGSGIDLCKEIRSSSEAFVVFITANDLEVDIVTGLAVGADDYITKPFSLAVLRSKINAILRRRKESQEEYFFDGFCMNFTSFSFTYKGTPMFLSGTEVKLLSTLLRNSGQVLSRDQLNYAVWGEQEAFVEENALSVAVGRLRSKLKEHTQKEYIKTIYGIGYQWESSHE